MALRTAWSFCVLMCMILASSTARYPSSLFMPTEPDCLDDLSNSHHGNAKDGHFYTRAVPILSDKHEDNPIVYTDISRPMAGASLFSITTSSIPIRFVAQHLARIYEEVAGMNFHDLGWPFGLITICLLRQHDPGHRFFSGTDFQFSLGGGSRCCVYHENDDRTWVYWGFYGAFG